MVDLSPTQLKLLSMIFDGSTGKLPETMMKEYADVITYVMENEIIRMPELSILQRDGIKFRFLRPKVRRELEAQDIFTYETEAEATYFAELACGALPTRSIKNCPSKNSRSSAN